MNQSLCARRNGYQYMAIFSDTYNEMPGAVIEKLNNLLLETEYGIDYTDEARHLENQYIKLSDIKNEKVIKPIWYGLKDDCKERLPVENTLDTYMKWLDENENATRIYSCGRMKIERN